MNLIQRIIGRGLRNRTSRDLVLAHLPKRSVGAEIGVYKGDFSEKVLDVVQPIELHLIDPWKYEQDEEYTSAWYGGSTGVDQSHMDQIYNSVLQRFQVEINAGIVAVHRSTSLKAASQFDQGYFDWVYLDGNHLYRFVKQDIEVYYQKVREGGYIAGDDYGVVGWWDDGVTKAVDEFRSKELCRTVLIHGDQFVLQKSNTQIEQTVRLWIIETLRNLGLTR